MSLPIPRDALNETELYAPGRHLVAEVLLGQLNGLRAVRFLSEDTLDEPEMDGEILVPEPHRPAPERPLDYQEPIEGKARPAPSQLELNSPPPDAPGTELEPYKG
jgi:hypothetical protein